jgi:hypothetical protein
VNSDETLSILREIRDELRGLRETLQRDRPRRPEADAAAIAGLREIFGALGGDFRFSTSDLIEHAELPESASLHAALVEAVGSPLRAKRLGKWLRRFSGRDLDGLRLERVDADRYGAQWALRESRELTPSHSLPARGETRKIGGGK